jgi:hypothetical protein
LLHASRSILETAVEPYETDQSFCLFICWQNYVARLRCSQGALKIRKNQNQCILHFQVESNLGRKGENSLLGCTAGGFYINSETSARLVSGAITHPATGTLHDPYQTGVPTLTNFGIFQIFK